MKNIIEGCIIGISSGIVVSLFVWLMRFIDNFRARRKQIKRINDIIVEFRKRIYSINKPFSFQGTPYSVDEQRKASFDDMTRQLYSAIDSGSPNLSYDEIQEIRTPFVPYTDLYPDVRPNIGAFKEMFKTLEKIQWLKLPPPPEK